MNLVTIAQKCFGTYLNHPQGTLTVHINNRCDTTKLNLTLNIKYGGATKVDIGLGKRLHSNNVEFNITYDIVKNQLTDVSIVDTVVKDGAIKIEQRLKGTGEESLQGCQQLLNQIITTKSINELAPRLSVNFINKLDVLNDLGNIISIRDRQITLYMLPFVSEYKHGKDAIKVSRETGVFGNSFVITTAKIKRVTDKGHVTTNPKTCYTFNIIKKGDSLVFYTRGGVGVDNIPKDTYMPITNLREINGLIAKIITL